MEGRIGFSRNGEKRMHIIQNALYGITEWDGTRDYVEVQTVGGRTTRRRSEGTPFTKKGGDVLMRYSDGVTHRVSARYFASLDPAVAMRVTHRDLWN